MEINIKDNLKRVIKMVKEFLLIKMEDYIKVYFKIINLMDTEPINGLMVINIKKILNKI
jgi:hypothetical protein